MSDFATFNNLADEATARAAADKALDTRVAALEGAPSGGVNFSFVDHEVVTLDANNEYLLAAAPAGIVAGSIPLVVVDSAVQDGVTAAKTYEMLNDAGGIKRKLRVHPRTLSFSVQGDAKLAVPPGQSSTALYLDGNADWLVSAVDADTVLGTGDFTVECWIYPTALTWYHSVVGTRTSSASLSNMYNIGLLQNGAVYFYTDHTVLQSAAGAITVDNWFHVAVTRQNGQAKLWLNGALVASAANSQNFSEAKFDVGAQGNGAEPYYGYVRDVRLTVGVARYSGTFTPPASPLTVAGDVHAGGVALLSTFAGTAGSTKLKYSKNIGGALGADSQAYISYRTNQPQASTSFGFVDHEVVTLDANNEYSLAAAPSGIVAGSIPLVVVDGVILDGRHATDKRYEMVAAGGVTNTLRMLPVRNAFTTHGDAKLAAGPGNSAVCLSLDGNSDYLKATAASLVLGTSSFTIEAFVYYNTLSGYSTIVSARPDSAGYADAFHLGVSPDGTVLMYSDGWGALSSAGVITAGVWHHIALVRNGTATRIYKNGVQVATGTNSQNFTRNTWSIGALGNGAEPTNGFIKSVRVTKAARYTAAFTAPTAPLALTGDAFNADVLMLADFVGTAGSTSLTYAVGGAAVLAGAKVYVSYRANNA